uniref:RING-type domain-containing protein n=1 Tax=viral metagenome TaxID=1070528 RepID=A0A6C0CAJ5_9ZZZZ
MLIIVKNLYSRIKLARVVDINTCALLLTKKMITKFLYRIYTVALNDDIEYDDGSGTIYINDTPIHKRHCTGNRPFFHFNLTFDSYHYRSIYCPDKKCIQKNVAGKTYYLYFCLNIDTVLAERHNSWMFRKLRFYFAQLQAKQIIEKKCFKIDIYDCKKFINSVEKKHLSLIPWYMYQINDKYVINFKENNNSIVSANVISKLSFKKKGGIIETNSPVKIVRDNFADISNNDFVILPKSMSKIWTKTNAHVMTYDELIRIERNNMQKIMANKWKRLIIHECHQQFLGCIKNLIKKINCEIIWIINALPLYTYFFTKNNNFGCIEISSLLQLWLDHKNTSKSPTLDKTYRIEINRFIFTSFNSMYARINYDSMDIDRYDTIYPNHIEKNIVNELNVYYDKWKNHLTNDRNNKYSFVTQKRLSIIDNNFFNAMMTLSLSITDGTNLKRFITSKIDKSLKRLKRVQNMLKEIVTSFSDCSHVSLDQEFIENSIEDFQKDLTNYTRYLSDKHYFVDNADKTTCPICYEPFTSGTKSVGTDIIKVNLICDHHICMECMVRSLTNNNECPICREHITVSEMVIVKETISNYSSELVNFFRNMNRYTVILSEFSAIENVVHNFYDKPSDAPKFFDLRDKMVMSKIRKLSKVNNVYVITSNNVTQHKYVTNYVGYFNSFNTKPNVIQINIPIS